LAEKSPNKPKDAKAGALLCPACCVEYVEVQFDCELDGVVLHDVKALRCPNCEEEVLTPQQQQAVTNRLNSIKRL